ncbi:Fic family protein [uncultured Sulfuricurvum sp.]|uniref:Fic family protein n=1 Tax=uncultured Sulfuricurvum sp. TaxID=430693 RepID=UPI002630886C|nr:Fic family protein [uncultured Sulfuricurvum sp.]
MQTYQTYIWQNSDWPHFTYDPTKFHDMIQEIRYQQGLLEGVCNGLTTERLLEMQSETLALDAVTTSEIEGEVLSRDSVRSSIFKKLGISYESQDRSTVQTDGLIDILLDASRNTAKTFDVNRLYSWHAALFPTGYSGMHKINVASYRGDDPMQVVSGHIGKEKVHYIAPPRNIVEDEMQRFFDFINIPTNENGYVRAAIAHLWFVIIHPMDDGNGRIARALSDMMLSRAENSPIRLYSMSSAINDSKRSYYDILELTTTGTIDISAWIEWFLQTVLTAQKNAHLTIEKVVAKARFWQLHIHNDLNPRQKKVLNRLLDAGKEGFEGGMNARKYASLCDCSRVTASRDLSDLLDKGCIKSRGAGGRSTSYDVEWESTK